MHPYVADTRLRKEERLLKKADFDAVFETRQSVGNRRMVLHWRENTLGFPRLGLVVGRKFGGAVQRNRFKRRVRELFRRNKARLGALDVAIMPAKGPEAAAADYDQLAEAFTALLNRLGTRRPVPGAKAEN